jgi:hypothetical protein
MKALSFLTALTLLAGIATPATLRAAEKPKAPSVADYPFWTVKKRGYAGPLVPGLNAVLQLSDAQNEQIAAIRDAISNEEAVKAARSISKNDPSVTAEQRDQARVTLERSTERLREKVAVILSAEQKVLIEKINAAYATAVEETGIVYEDKFAAVKADPAARRRIQDEKSQDTEEQFLHKLDALLTSTQKEAMTRAADEEEHRNVKAAAVKKPAK